MKVVKFTPEHYSFIGPATVRKYKTDDRVLFVLPDGSSHTGSIHGLAIGLAGSNLWIVHLDEAIQDEDTGEVFKSMMIGESQLFHV